MTSDGTSAYAYSSENLLTSAGASGPLDYGPLMRFYRNYITYFIHDTGSGSGAGGGQLIGDYYNGNIVGRYVPGPGVDEPLVSVGKTGARTWFHADERGSVIAGSDGAGANARIILYDENGKRGGGGSYRFAFTGQVHLINDVYDYKSRNYNARLSRFLQTDRIGYGGGMNLYAYVGNDPVNRRDPLGLDEVEIFVTGKRLKNAGCDPTYFLFGQAAGGILRTLHWGLDRWRETARCAPRPPRRVRQRVGAGAQGRGAARGRRSRAARRSARDDGSRAGGRRRRRGGAGALLQIDRKRGL